MTWLGIVGVALGGITLASLFTGGDGRAEISAELSESIPQIAGFFEVSTMVDLRDFNEPSADLRARFTSSGEVYRVIDSSVDRARIAIWRTDVPGPGPGPHSSDPDRGFSTEELVVGTACASIERTGHRVTSTPVGCRHPLAAWSPPAEVASWTRDADAVVDVIKKARSSSAETSIRVTVEDFSQERSRIMGKVRIATSAPEEANTTAIRTSSACFTLDMDLQLLDQYGLWEPLIPEELGAANCAGT